MHLPKHREFVLISSNKIGGKRLEMELFGMCLFAALVGIVQYDGA